MSTFDADGVESLLHLRRLNVLKWKNLDQPLSSHGDVRPGGIDQFGIHFRLFTFRHDEDELAGFDHGNSLQRQGAVNERNRFPRSDLFRTHNGQLALGLGTFDHALAGGLSEPLDDHVNVRTLKTHLNFIRGGDQFRSGREGRGFVRANGQ
jgi:hypothetical protein